MNIIQKKDIASEQFFFLTASVVDHSGKKWNDLLLCTRPNKKMVSGWFKYTTFIVYFISIVIMSATPQIVLDPRDWGPCSRW